MLLRLSNGDMTPSQSRSIVGVCLITIVIVELLGLAACSPVETSTNVPAASPPRGITHDSPMPDPDLVITPAQSGQVIELVRGQIIGVANPSSSIEWQVHYSSDELEMLTPPGQVHAPGPEGWRFRALAPGQSDLVLTSITPPCSDSTPCPPMPARFIFTIEVK